MVYVNYKHNIGYNFNLNLGHYRIKMDNSDEIKETDFSNTLRKQLIQEYNVYAILEHRRRILDFDIEFSKYFTLILIICVLLKLL